MSASNIDFMGRRILTPPHRSNCLVFALIASWQHGGRIGVRMGHRFWPHFYVTTPDGRRIEFVYGQLGRGWIWFRGYGVESRP